MTSGPADLALAEQAPALKRVEPARARSGLVTLAQLLAYLSPIAVAGLVYELLRGVFPYRGRVHVADLWAAEARLFSVMTARGPRPLAEVISQHTAHWLDAWCGATYLLFLIELVAASVYLFFRARPRALELSLGFLVLNLVGWAIWFVYPAAPPWYVDQYGFGPAVLDVVSSPAGLLRLDGWLGIPMATRFYAKSANVFGAMPSLHVGYAMLVAWVVAPLAGSARWLAIGFALSMAFSAVYLRHHYLLDVIAGMLLAGLVAAAVRASLRRAGAARARRLGAARAAGGPR